jgi:hypothetical protein
MGAMGKHLQWGFALSACVLLLVCSGPRQAAADDDMLGFRVGLGEVGTFGGSLTLRLADYIGLEFGAGFYFYMLDYGSDTETGLVLTGGSTLAYYLTPMNAPTQRSINLHVTYNEVIGPAVGVSYGIEWSSGWYLRIGVAFAPDGEDTSREWLEDEIGRPIDNYDYTWIPIYFAVGLTF